MSEKPVIIIGNGGHAKVLVDILQQQSREIIGFTAPSEEKNENGLLYIGNDKSILQYSPEKIELVNALGSTSNTEHRKKIYEYFKAKFYSFSKVVHPKAINAENNNLGEGTQIMAGAIIQPFVKIADNSIVNTSVSIDHDCSIGKHCHIAPGTILSGGVTVGNSTHIGVGATITQNVKIGSNVLIGAASLVLADVNTGSTVYGIPAKEV
ncbi:acetyltransferase [Virgibacillus doumboii]|uniref:acetyltransferase n=1 Tax=Virgibacillus doumboii TaxID=2697503 RepID=UPI0013DFD474|nr:acetyltransferase [Virgibacillus doumboii]